MSELTKVKWKFDREDSVDVQGENIKRMVNARLEREQQLIEAALWVNGIEIPEGKEKNQWFRDHITYREHPGSLLRSVEYKGYPFLHVTEGTFSEEEGKYVFSFSYRILEEEIPEEVIKSNNSQ